jgi:hypothetical protein
MPDNVTDQQGAGSEPRRFVADAQKLPASYPTHLHSPEFWEALGRAVAAFGFLEETLGKAIFVFTGTRQIPEDQIEEALERWLPTLERAMYDQLGSLIDSYGAAVRANSNSTITNLDSLLNDLRAVSRIRNVICHGSWRAPDSQGRSVPFFVNRGEEVFQTPIDIAYLNSLRLYTVELCVAVINTVTHMGWQFPGSSGPGNPVWGPRTGQTG